MLVFTGVLLGVVLVVMVGESVQEMQQAVAADHDARPADPRLDGRLVRRLPECWRSLVAQLLAALVVIGSYVVAADLRVRRPRRRGETPALPAEQQPTRSVTIANPTIA